MRILQVMGLLILTSGWSAVTGALEAQPRFVINAQGDGNEVTVRVAGGAVIVDVHSRSGIGAAAVELVSGDVPHDIVLRFHLPALEIVRLSWDQIAMTASIPGDRDEPVSQRIVSSTGDDRPITPGSAFWMNIRFASDETPRDERTIEVALPVNPLREDQHAFYIEWIDHYR